VRRARLAAAVPALAVVLVAPSLEAQGTFRLVVDGVAESRERTAANETGGALVLMPRLEGEGLGEAQAFRIRVVSARDDTGRSLLPEEEAPARWEKSATGEGLRIRLASPARAATTATVTGTVELWAPGRDRGAEVVVPKALSRYGKPFASPGLKVAGVMLGLAPRDQVAEDALSITGRKQDLEKVLSVRVVASDGSEVVPLGARTGVVAGAETLELFFSEPPPADAALVFGLVTKKSLLSVPFELEDVPLP